MSYSSCASCEAMVPAYEKYCRTCLNRFPQLRQVVDFWKNFTGGLDAAKQLAAREKKVHPETSA